MGKFNLGDVVKLKSDSGVIQRMTVERTTDYQVECVWFDKDKNCHRAWFRETSLERY